MTLSRPDVDSEFTKTGYNVNYSIWARIVQSCKVEGLDKLVDSEMSSEFPRFLRRGSAIVPTVSGTTYCLPIVALHPYSIPEQEYVLLHIEHSALIHCCWVVGHLTDSGVFVKVSVVDADFGLYGDPPADAETCSEKEEQFWSTISSTEETVQLG